MKNCFEITFYPEIYCSKWRKDYKLDRLKITAYLSEILDGKVDSIFYCYHINRRQGIDGSADHLHLIVKGNNELTLPLLIQLLSNSWDLGSIYCKSKPSRF